MKKGNVETNFLAMADASQRSVNPEEQHRENLFPEMCSPECEYITCGFRTEENKGRPCFMKWKQFKTPPQPLSDPLARAPIPLQTQIDQALKRAFRPLFARLEAIENQTVQRSIDNGQKYHLSSAYKLQITHMQESLSPL